MQAKNGSVITTVIVCAVVLALLGCYAFSQIPEAQDIVIPTAAEIAALISIPDTTMDMSKIDELWDNLFGYKIGILEDEAEDYVDSHMEWADMREYVEDNLEDFEDFTIDRPRFNIDSDETEITVIDLGEVKVNSITYNEDEDSKVTITLEYDFEYEKDTGVVGDAYRGTLYVTADYTYDFEDTEAEVEFTYSL